MSGKSALYEKYPLNPNQRSIRTLRLLPGNGHQQISCQISVMNLEDGGIIYDCLSYVWGLEIASDALRIENEDFQVTVNLLSCLRYLRHSHDSVVIWVDAVCINQDNLEEKSAQVSMMGHIYSRCSNVYCWLGAPADASLSHHDPFKFLDNFAEDKHYHNLPGYHLDGDQKVIFEDSGEFTILWEAFLPIAQSTWWTRAWTAQEAILPESSIVCYGKWRMSFDKFIVARRMRNDHLFIRGTGCCDTSLKLFPVEKRVVFDSFLTQVEWIERFCQDKKTGRFPDDQPRIFPDYQLRPFYEAVLTFSPRLCSDPRDRIFALFALAKSSVYTKLRPDYTRTADDTYTQTFQLMLEETNNDYRCMIGSTFGSTNPNCPSWVPDFSHPISPSTAERTMRRIFFSSLFRASRGESGTPRCIEDKGLSLAGIHADTVISISAHLNEALDCLGATLMKWHTFCGETLGTSDNDAVRLTLSRVICTSLYDDWALIHGRHRTWRRAQEVDLPTPEEWAQLMKGNRWALRDGYRGTLEDSCFGRSLFATTNGKLGLCYEKTQPGDEVWVVKGSDIPFILRKVCGRNQSRSCYHFVGDCFLDGIMDGEAVSTGSEWVPVILK